ncbi:MAG: 7-cyano-7-deazaguanine synthase [Bacilli bacterium]|nr:7-cyano-7-deazaguanine synthase [Bacilli bacterium]
MISYEYDGILLASGGMDSTVLAYKLLHEKKKIIPLFINYGQHCAENELQHLRNLLPKSYVDNLKIINISDIYKLSPSRMIVEANLWEEEVSAADLILPYRNLMFLVVAAAFAETIKVRNIYAAFINSNHAKEIDCSNAFFNETQSVLREIGSVNVVLPFRYLSKLEVAKIGLSLDIPIDSTFSCQVNSKIPCGACPNCVDRINALSQLFEEK